MDKITKETFDPNDREYSNGEITVFWRPKKCIHVTTCYRELIEVFNPRKRPWINMGGAPTSEIIRVVDMCPTKALTYKWNRKEDEDKHPKTTNMVMNEDAGRGSNEEDKKEKEETITEIRVMKDGPLVVKGNFKIIDVNKNELAHMKMASFCRCGASRNMPFCDGTHRKIGFTSD